MSGPGFSPVETGKEPAALEQLQGLALEAVAELHRLRGEAERWPSRALGFEVERLAAAAERTAGLLEVRTLEHARPAAALARAARGLAHELRRVFDRTPLGSRWLPRAHALEASAAQVLEEVNAAVRQLAEARRRPATR